MENSRRDFIKKSVTLTLGTVAVNSLGNLVFSSNLMAGTNDVETLFTLPELGYAYNGLEPYIDALTMEIHHSKHHQGYVNKLNKALATIDESTLEGYKSLTNIFLNVSKLPAAVRNNAGGHYNHSLFWNFMSPNGKKQPGGKLAEDIALTFGSFEEFKFLFADAAKKRFGSGWAWLVVSEGKLVITSTANQDNPLMNLDEIEVKGTPILALDVWEHAYYLKNQNRRGDYIDAWWNVVNWQTSEEIYNNTLRK